MNLRVVRRWANPEDLVYTIEDVCEVRGWHPFVEHGPFGLLRGDSLEDLSERLDALKAALKKPVLVLQPERLTVEK